ncbi:hypothetical protein J6590_050936 [Homalodisca vitripennis]|nr:hypothetical protein J6590_050936 [Homalodisca vitripennis]
MKKNVLDLHILLCPGCALSTSLLNPNLLLRSVQLLHVRLLATIRARAGEAPTRGSCEAIKSLFGVGFPQPNTVDGPNTQTDNKVRSVVSSLYSVYKVPSIEGYIRGHASLEIALPAAAETPASASLSETFDRASVT